MAALTKLHCTADLMSADDPCGCVNSRMLGGEETPIGLHEILFIYCNHQFSAYFGGQNVSTTCNCLDRLVLELHYTISYIFSAPV